MPYNESDETVYSRFLTEHNEWDLRILLERHAEGLTLFLYGHVRSMEDAEELMMDAFAVAASGTARFSGRSSFKTWLFSIGRRKALMHLRKNRGYAELPAEDERLKATEGIPEFDILHKEQNRELYQAMQKMNPQYRTVLMLLYFEGMNYEEAGRVMKKSRKQMYHLTERAKERLREILEESGFEYTQYR